MDITPGTDMVTPTQARTYSEGFKHWMEGMHIQFPKFRHEHPPVIDVNKVADEQMTTGQRVADQVATTMGSWGFIIIQATLMIVWVTFNSVALFFHFDGYPYILLNLAMSAQAAFATPVILMSQNRQADKDRLTAQNDYLTDVKGEEEIRNIMEHLDHQDTVILEILQRMDDHHKELVEHLARLDPEMARRLGTDIQEIAEEEMEQEHADQ